MARLEDLVARISDTTLRRELEDALAELKRRKHFGLVFEEHIPEISVLQGLPVEVDSTVLRRSEPSARNRYTVTHVHADGTATVAPEEGGPPLTLSTSDLLVAKHFGEPMYPSLTPLGVVRRGDDARPHHAVINGENFHALQLLLYLYEGQVDCIYIDPPYNTGARDWKYNNAYVDDNDNWRHSKWISMIKKRLLLAKRLLKPDGVLIITIDEHEVFHLGLLLEDLFPEYLRYMITIVINPKGTSKANFSRVDEQAMFIVPNFGSERSVIVGRLSNSGQIQLPFNEQDVEQNSDMDEDDLDESLSEDEELEEVDVAVEQDDEWEYQHARRRGSESSYRFQRPNQFYPIYIDENERTVVDIGKSIGKDEEPDFTYKENLRPIWPIDLEGNHRCWRFITESMRVELNAGNLFLGRYNKIHNSWTINIRRRKKTVKKLKTVWWERQYDAGTHGTGLLRRIFGRPGLFPFPKSVYAVRDCLAAVVRDRPDALIVDFFAGSGTALHATALLNAELGGQRRCVLVTNNEVAEKTAQALHERGMFKGDVAFEAEGIFERVTRPRVEAVITGKRPDGTPIPGKHATGRPFSSGFAENVEFFRMDYLDADEVDLGKQFDAILPALWLAAGGIRSREHGAAESAQGFTMPAGAPYAVLFHEGRFRQFKAALQQRAEITHIWLVTDSERAFAEMRAELSGYRHISMLYRDYLRNFQINTEKIV